MKTWRQRRAVGFAEKLTPTPPLLVPCLSVGAVTLIAAVCILAAAEPKETSAYFYDVCTFSQKGSAALR